MRIVSSPPPRRTIRCNRHQGPEPTIVPPRESAMTGSVFHVGLTRDCLGLDGKPVFDAAALGLLQRDGMSYGFLDEFTPVVTTDQAARCDALVVMRPKVERSTLARPDRRLRLVARFGVGYDNIDVDACTEAGVALTIAPDGVRRPVATVILTFILALSHKLFA